MAFKPFPQETQTKLIPTQEQENIISVAKTGVNIAIQAYAGAAKTSTCTMVADALQKESLYIAFNKSIADEAIGKFPSHVECRTIHSLAYGTIIDFKMRKKLQNFFNYNDLESLPSWYKLGGLEKGIDLKLEIIEVIKKFCQSSMQSLSGFINTEWKDLELDTEKNAIQTLCLEYWANLINPSDSTKITPDIYLKLYQLSRPVLEYDIIYLDESQDSNEVTLDIVLRQKAQIIIVGDPYQAIYEWRGAVNAFDKIPDSFKTMYLTESFRFTQDIADKATKLLSIVGNEANIIGNAKEKECKNYAVLARNNSTILQCLIDAVMMEKKVYCLANLKELWGKLYHIQALQFNEKPRYPDKELSEYKTIGDLKKTAEKLPELKKLLNATATLSAGGLHKNIENIKSILVESPDNADFTISTVHKSKGLEWDRVIISEDIVPLQSEGEDEDIEYEYLTKNQGLNLMYVAITRAKYKVELPYELERILGEL